MEEDLRTMINTLLLEAINECTCTPEQLMGIDNSICVSCYANKVVGNIEDMVKKYYEYYREVYK